MADARKRSLGHPTDRVKTLDARAVIGLMREAWDKKVKGLVNELDTHFKQADGEKKQALSNGLKLRHTSSQLLYTVDSIGTKDVTLVTPEGQTIVVNHKTIDDQYTLD